MNWPKRLFRRTVISSAAGHNAFRNEPSNKRAPSVVRNALDSDTTRIKDRPISINRKGTVPDESRSNLHSGTADRSHPDESAETPVGTHNRIEPNPPNHPYPFDIYGNGIRRKRSPFFGRGRRTENGEKIFRRLLDAFIAGGQIQKMRTEKMTARTGPKIPLTTDKCSVPENTTVQCGIDRILR